MAASHPIRAEARPNKWESGISKVSERLVFASTWMVARRGPTFFDVDMTSVDIIISSHLFHSKRLTYFKTNTKEYLPRRVREA